ncbi:MAG: hypothetical protein M1416_02755 [Candidatus Pacearchaeota archaeon]|nr:hypothetical protein [Candidatus Pacearchaeota archaeon]
MGALDDFMKSLPLVIMPLSFALTGILMFGGYCCSVANETNRVKEMAKELIKKESVLSVIIDENIDSRYGKGLAFRKADKDRNSVLDFEEKYNLAYEYGLVGNNEKISECLIEERLRNASNRDFSICGCR